MSQRVLSDGLGLMTSNVQHERPVVGKVGIAGASKCDSGQRQVVEVSARVGIVPIYERVPIVDNIDTAFEQHKTNGALHAGTGGTVT